MRLIDADELKTQSIIVSAIAGKNFQKLVDAQQTIDEAAEVKRILLRLHEVGGCDAQDDYSKGWDEAITEAIKIVENETRIKIGEVLD